MPKKPIKEGYKVYGIADHGYLYAWIWSSREKGLQAIFKHPTLTPTGSLVRTLALTLPRRQIAIYMDNYFTSVPLFVELQACKFGVVGTTRPHKAFPDSLSTIKKRFAKKLPWNTLLAAMEQDILCLAWQDNNIVLGLSNIHIVDKVEDMVEKKRRRPAKTSTNGRIVREVFGTDSVKELRIPSFIDDYNQNMGGVDLANQFREAYETHKPSFRNWWPLFYWLIDVACVNSYILYRLHTTEKPPLSHLKFRQELARKLLSYSEKAQLQSLRVGLGGRRVFSPELQHLHYWERRSKKGTCAWCSYEARCRKVLGKEVKGALKRPPGGCVFCDVPLCKEGGCWRSYHSIDVAY
jgi:hypothetical protein